MADLSHFTKEIYKLLTSIHEESYLEVNQAETVKYPYLTYTYSAEALEYGSEGFYLDIDLFERSTSYSRLTALENSLKNGLDRHLSLTDTALFRFKFNGSTPIPTQDNDLKRRNLRFYIKIDWRDLNG